MTTARATRSVPTDEQIEAIAQRTSEVFNLALKPATTAKELGDAAGELLSMPGASSFPGQVAVLVNTLGCIHRINAKNSARNVRLGMLEERVDGLEAKGLSFEGTWKSGTAYRRGQAVVRAGSLFIALKDTVVDPRDPHAGAGSWALAAERGRSAR